MFAPLAVLVQMPVCWWLRYFCITCCSAGTAAGVVFGLMQPVGPLESSLVWVGHPLPAAPFAAQCQVRFASSCSTEWQTARTGCPGWKYPGFVHKGKGNTMWANWGWCELTRTGSKVGVEAPKCVQAFFFPVVALASSLRATLLGTSCSLLTRHRISARTLICKLGRTLKIHFKHFILFFLQKGLKKNQSPTSGTFFNCCMSFKNYFRGEKKWMMMADLVLIIPVMFLMLIPSFLFLGPEHHSFPNQHGHAPQRPIYNGEHPQNWLQLCADNILLWGGSEGEADHLPLPWLPA